MLVYELIQSEMLRITSGNYMHCAMCKKRAAATTTTTGMSCTVVTFVL